MHEPCFNSSFHASPCGGTQYLIVVRALWTCTAVKCDGYLDFGKRKKDGKREPKTSLFQSLVSEATIRSCSAHTGALGNLQARESHTTLRRRNCVPKSLDQFSTCETDHEIDSFVCKAGTFYCSNS